MAQNVMVGGAMKVVLNQEEHRLWRERGRQGARFRVGLKRGLRLSEMTTGRAECFVCAPYGEPLERVRLPRLVQKMAEHMARSQQLEETLSGKR